MLPFLKKRWVQAIALGFLALLLVLYPTTIEPNWVQVVKLNMTLPNLDPEFENYRLVQLTDIHADEWMTKDRLKKLVNRVNQLKPDLVAITGDLVTNNPEVYGENLLELKNLETRDGVYSVLGNHDHWSNPLIVRLRLAEANIRDLKNEVVTVTRNGKRIAIAGVDDVWVGEDDLSAVMRSLPSDSANIVLVHEPDFADKSAQTQRFDLELSGHAHGGQVKIPFIGAPQLPPYGRKYPFGLYQVQEMKQYTARGLGMVRPRVRFNARPEITVFQLHAKKSKLQAS